MGVMLAHLTGSAFTFILVLKKRSLGCVLGALTHNLSAFVVLVRNPFQVQLNRDFHVNLL
jgi:hypothetical protein